MFDIACFSEILGAVVTYIEESLQNVHGLERKWLPVEAKNAEDAQSYIYVR
jgi:hypothetical protein